MPEDPKTIDVAIVEDLREIRDGLAMLINGTQGFRCTGRYRTMEEALSQIDANLPDVVISDIGLPGMSGTEGIRILRERYPSLPILALTIFEDDDEVFEALCAGACGYLLKNTPPARLLESVREVYDGGAPMSPSVARRVVALFREFQPPERATFRLTPQEKELLSCSSAGTNTRRQPTGWGSRSTRLPSTCATSTQSSRSTPNPRPLPAPCATGSSESARIPARPPCLLV
ncbi:MAG: response regulator transcription factor [Blastocatellia bacterium]|nr:response regulator transcription factor [Blastocatellia bacterium]